MAGLATFHRDLGITDGETAAIGLRPERMAKVYPIEWDAALFASMDRQARAVAVIDVDVSHPRDPEDPALFEVHRRVMECLV